MAEKKMTPEEKYLAFLRNHLGISLHTLPKRIGRRQKRVEGWLIPPFRYSGNVLIPEINFYPCDLCEFARYNALCALQSKCAAYAFWSVQKLSTFEARTPVETKAVAMRHFGVKRRKRTNGKKAKIKAGRRTKGKRVGNNKNYRKPAVKSRKQTRKQK